MKKNFTRKGIRRFWTLFIEVDKVEKVLYTYIRYAFFQAVKGNAGKTDDRRIEEKSFAGIYVDKRAYDEEGFVSLYASLKAELDCEPIDSANGNLYFYEF